MSPDRSESVLAAEPAHYRPHIDGLRAVAVYLVVAFHAGLGVFAGGFIGVDVFFVLSGYLVTGILLRDLIASGRIDFRRFYARRFRRILPAAAVALLVTAVVYSIVATPVEMLDVLGGFKAAFLYVANWYFIRQSVDYFASDINRNPVLHFWSLAVEEQFYLVWPLLFGALFLVTRRVGRLRWWALRVIIGVAAIASGVAAWHIAATNVNRAYYGTDTRAYQLLAGALIALTPQLMRLGRRYGPVLRRVAPFALVLLVIASTSLLDVGPITRGVFTVALSAALIISLENARSSGVARALASGPMAYLGRISYATYLWHWPIIVIATHSRSISPVPLFILATVASSALAILSYHLVERPVRSSRWLDRYRLPVIAVGLAISMVAGLLVLPAILTPDSGSISGGTGVALNWQKARFDIPKLVDCLGKPVTACEVVHGSGKRILLVGDSNARMWIPTFTAIARRRSMSLAVAAFPDCPWQRGLQYDFGPRIVDPCKKHQDDWYQRVVPQYAPDIVVLVHEGFDDALHPLNMKAPDGRPILLTSPTYESKIASLAGSSLQALRAPGRTVVMLESIPLAPLGFDPLSCISKGGPIAKCAYRSGKSPTKLERYYRSVSDGKSFIAVDADRLVCPRLPTCDAAVGGLIVKRDAGHLTATFALSLAPAMASLLTNNGVLPRA